MRTYKSRVRGALGVALLGIAGMTAVSSIVLRVGTDQWPFVIKYPLLLLAAAGGLWACMPYWRTVDQMEREAQTTSWFWGGSAGAIAGLFALTAAGVSKDMAMGAALLAIIQFAGFLLFYFGWRLRHRGSPE